MRLHIRYIFLIVLLSFAYVANAQNVRDYIREGNRLFHQRQFVKAEVSYRKAIAKDHNSTEAQFNLGNALLMQAKAKKAIQQFQKAAQTTNIKIKKAKAFHNIGEIYEMSKQYQQAISSYKQSLRYNPHDNETRYNLALCQKLLKQQPPQDNKNNKNKNKKNNDKDKNKQNKDQNKNQNKNNNQNKNQQNKQQQQQPKDQISKENAEQMLNAALEDEKNAQQKNRKVQSSDHKLEKNW